MKTRLGRLPDGRIFCGYVLTQNCCRAIYTHPSVFASKTIRHNRAATSDTSVYNGQLNQVELYTLDGTTIGSQWYMPALAEAVLLLNLTNQLTCVDLDKEYPGLLHSVIRLTPMAIVDPPVGRLYIASSTGSQPPLSSSVSRTSADTMWYKEIHTGVYPYIASYQRTLTLDVIYLVQSERVEL